MARPRKNGLDYFPFDVDLYDDEKLIDVQLAYGPLGESIYTRLLCLAYKNGYYYKFESLDSLAALLIRSIGGRWARNKKTVIEVILYLAEINLFSSELMRRNVITSRSIQLRYAKAAERRRSGISEYNLLEKNDFQEGFQSAPKNPVIAAETPVFVAETPVFADNNPTKESKVKENTTTSTTAAPAANVENPMESNAPTLTEIQAYASELTDAGAETIAQKFYAYYEKTGWKTRSGTPVTDWKEMLRYWAKRERKADVKSGRKKKPPEEEPEDIYRELVYNRDG